MQELFWGGQTQAKYFEESFDEGRNCDVYSSTLLHKKYNFKYYYIEYPNNYIVKFGFDNYSGEQKSGWLSSLWFFLKYIILILVGVGVLIFLYFWCCKKRN